MITHLCAAAALVCFAIGLAVAVLDLTHPRPRAPWTWICRDCGVWLWPHRSDAVTHDDGHRSCWRCDRDARARAMGCVIFPR